MENLNVNIAVTTVNFDKSMEHVTVVHKFANNAEPTSKF
jgi:hypothetical protein